MTLSSFMFTGEGGCNVKTSVPNVSQSCDKIVYIVRTCLSDEPLQIQGREPYLGVVIGKKQPESKVWHQQTFINQFLSSVA